jgi:hypothetical protein
MKEHVAAMNGGLEAELEEGQCSIACILICIYTPHAWKCVSVLHTRVYCPHTPQHVF